MKAEVILTLVLSACICTACQQNTTPSPTSAIPDKVSAITTQPDSEPDRPTPTSEPTPPLQSEPDIVEYAVYNDLLKSDFAGDQIDQVLIMDHTRINSVEHLEMDLTEFQKNTPLAPELIASFKERNQEPTLLKPILDFGMEYHLLTQEKVDELCPLDEASGWKWIDEKYPNAYGFVYLSRVGFNADMSQALIYKDAFHCGFPISGGYYLMIKQDGVWVVETGYEWIS